MLPCLILIQTVSTARFDGTGWQTAQPHINGHMLLEGTIAARQLQLDGVTLKPDETGALAVGAISARAITQASWPLRISAPALQDLRLMSLVQLNLMMW